MASNYWIKLYHEILHDRKMATLSWSTGALRFAAELHRDGGKITTKENK